ncbi:hypothetical protein AVEN_207262-1 [Araneus ventricosus]|uniref:Uncharacterized protein n=1 Tax=Araneus ventricosus TaxID=182803 RepID=A0A4Y2S5T1_ARAVE|nr:hypothetical protein AVEN_207262-1 [Araneus ventricosus]
MVSNRNSTGCCGIYPSENTQISSEINIKTFVRSLLNISADHSVLTSRDSKTNFSSLMKQEEEERALVRNQSGDYNSYVKAVVLPFICLFVSAIPHYTER